MKVELRLAQDSDKDFAYGVKQAALGPLIEHRWGWHEQYQRGLHDEYWQTRPWVIITCDTVPAGTLSVDRRERTIRLSGFYLLPEWQGQGVGSRALRQVLNECDAKDRDCRLRLLKGSRAEAFFKRFGFHAVGQEDSHVTMIRYARVL